MDFNTLNLRNLAKLVKKIQENPEIRKMDMELFIGSNPVAVYASFKLPNRLLARLRENFSPGTDAEHKEACMKLQVTKDKIRRLKQIMKDNKLTLYKANESFGEDSYTQVYVQNISLHNHDWIYDRETDLYIPRERLIADERVRNAVKKTGIDLTLSDCRVVLTRELYDNLDVFLSNLTPIFEGYKSSILTFEQYTKYYEWAKKNDRKLWKSFDYLGGEVVRNRSYQKVAKNEGYQIAISISGKPELTQIDFNSDFYSWIRISETKILY